MESTDEAGLLAIDPPLEEATKGLTLSMTTMMPDNPDGSETDGDAPGLTGATGGDTVNTPRDSKVPAVRTETPMETKGTTEDFQDASQANRLIRRAAARKDQLEVELYDKKKSLAKVSGRL